MVAVGNAASVFQILLGKSGEANLQLLDVILELFLDGVD
jgi:hypothetical protein